MKIIKAKEVKKALKLEVIVPLSDSDSDLIGMVKRRTKK
jgi:hypothetical protein